MDISVRAYEEKDLPAMIRIWNEVVEEGIAFPQEELLDESTGRAFFASQTYCGVAEDTGDGSIFGLYILHPNNVGRCGHICNASYAVSSKRRGLHIGERLVLDCLVQGKSTGSGYCSSMLSFLPIFTQGISMSGLVLSGWERFRKGFGKRTGSMKTYVRTIVNCDGGYVHIPIFSISGIVYFFILSRILTA